MVALTRSTSSALGQALARLVEAVEDENASLDQQTIASHADFTDRKNQALRELMAAQRRDAGGGDAVALRPMLLRLSGALQRNTRLLKHHIAAVGEVSDILVRALREAESDGTYSRGNVPKCWR